MMSPNAKEKWKDWLTLIFWTFFVIAFIYLVIFVKGLALTHHHITNR